VSILLVLHHPARPHVAFLDRIPGTRPYPDLARHRDDEQIPGVLAFRVESPILYFNVDHFFRIVLDRVDAGGKALRLIVCDLSTSPTVDIAGAKMFLDLQSELAKRQMILHLADSEIGTTDSADFTDFEEVMGGMTVRISPWQNFGCR
jgi:sulfate permease, SulP family